MAVWTFWPQVDYALQILRIPLGIVILVIYITAGYYLNNRKTKFGNCIYQLFHLFFVNCAVVLCSAAPAVVGLLTNSTQNIFARIGGCYLKYGMILFIYVACLCMGTIVGSCMWICNKLAHNKSVTRPIVLNFICIIIPWVASVTWLTFVLLNTDRSTAKQSCFLLTSVKKWMVKVGPGGLILVLICAMLCGIYVRRYSKNKLEDFALRQSHIPLSTRMELHQINKILDLVVSSVMLHMIPSLLAISVILALYGIMGQPVDSKKNENVWLLMGIISTLGCPVYSLWKIRSIEKHEISVIAEKNAQRLLLSQQKINWKLEPRVGHVRSNPIPINVKPSSAPFISIISPNEEEDEVRVGKPEHPYLTIQKDARTKSTRIISRVNLITTGLSSDVSKNRHRLPPIENTITSFPRKMLPPFSLEPLPPIELNALKKIISD